MLLRIDKVSGGNKPNDPQPSFDPPLHACLATATVHDDGKTNNGSHGGGDNAPTQGVGSTQLVGVAPGRAIASPPDDGERSSNNRTGEILTAGRKNCSVTMDDKCCSRNHAAISLLSNRPLDNEEAIVAAARSSCCSLGGNRALMEFGTPSTPEDVRACETSASGVICVVKDKGSKFGTFVSVDEGLLEEHRAVVGKDDGGQGGDGEETGDETDDEGAAGGEPVNYVELSEKQKRAVRLLSDDAAAVALPKFRKLAAHESVPLLQLSHSESGSKSGNPHVIILFGPQGSAVRLSLLPLQFTFSRIKKPELDPLLSSLHYVGASHSTQWDVERSTHLVAPEKTAAAKGIMAYACRRPVVTKGFIEALLERRSPEDGLPKEDNYCPKGTWDKNLIYTAEPSAALEGYRIAVMVDDDNAPLARSAGADILPIHTDAPSSSQPEFETWWGTQMRRALVDKMALVVVGSSSKKCKQFSDWLKHFDDGNVRFTSAKNIAKAITNNNGEGELLMDTRKVVIEKVDGWDGEKVADVGKEEDADTTDAMVAPERSVDVAVAEEENDGNFHQNYPDYENPPPDNDGEEEQSGEQEEMPVRTRRKRRQEEEAEERHNDAEEEQSERQKRHRTEIEFRAEVAAVDEQAARKSEPSPNRKRTRDGGDGAIEEEAAEEPRAAENIKKSLATTKKMRKQDDVRSDDGPGLPAERIPLPTTRDGWMVAAPKKRKAYRKEASNVADKDVPDGAAETEDVSGLIVRKYVPPNKGGNGRGAGRMVKDKGKKKDFKGFRKNSVLRGYTSFNPSGYRNHNNQTSLPKIRLVDVMPKESERQRQLQQQQEDYEREQELADQLFNDAGGAKSGRKRGGAGGMRAYLTQSTTKRGRGRR